MLFLSRILLGGNFLLGGSFVPSEQPLTFSVLKVGKGITSL